MHHISEDDLELYHLGMPLALAEVARIEEHLTVCPECADLSRETAEFISALRAALKRLQKYPQANAARAFKGGIAS